MVGKIIKNWGMLVKTYVITETGIKTYTELIFRIIQRIVVHYETQGDV